MYHIHDETKGLIFDVTEESFQKQVIEASHIKPILVDFWADWCAPCRMLTPILETAVAEYAGSWYLAKVEVDDNMRLAGHYKLRGFPTVLLFKDGEIIGRFASAKPLHWVREFIDEHL
ncbi:thioredoxin family protein [Candidatus Venteria ishoeyi]|uniref:Thioredoxin n=1 Tax=Candidatus Venteria ishoeyi TaxID=1899563 RepID=A0A1H6FD16_9GAMM|nr:thioredoxin domain-containing protein [Candidatus Venteria ishoeyi]MDM8545335.1 thioredoxin domain-containing protein [Candidatus Venteria ishoeyi]SEH07219.1 Thioredoxin [Candidatus Venteria ishoeyi]